MDRAPLEPESAASLWDRLRARLEEMRVALASKGGLETRTKKRAERAQLLRRQAGTAEAAEIRYFLAFGKGQKRYGIPVEHVLEVQALEHVSPVPRAPAAVIGVVHWRGALLALLDLSRLFGIVEAGLSDIHAYVVVESAGKRLALATTMLDDIIPVPAQRLQAAPALPANIAPEWILGVYDENCLMLNVDEIVKHLEKKSTT